MSKIGVGAGVVFMLLGVSVAVYPDWLISAVDWESRSGLYVAAAMRVVMGAILILAAPTSRTPAAFRVIGGVAFVVGLLFPLIPLESWAKLIRWWTVENLTLYRAGSALAAIPFGAYIAYAARPKHAE
jgi:hypothetical protein